MPPDSFTQQLTFVSDPGHGWLVVPLVDIARIGIADSISCYSFIDVSNSVAYLEEDCDVTRYLEALTAAGINRRTRDSSTSARRQRRPPAERSTPRNGGA